MYSHNNFKPYGPVSRSQNPAMCYESSLLEAINEPAHEILALFAIRKFILQTRMRSHPVALDV